jgi:hypothetical protein
MKIAINTVYGGYVLPKEFFEAHPDKDRLDYNCGHRDTIARTRTDPDVISFIESYGPDGYNDNDGTHIKIVDIPDDTSDWKVYEDDGAEWFIYVQDGKIHEVFTYMI